MIPRLAIIAGLGVMLAGCETLRGSIAGGECKVFEPPQYAVRGLRPYDQHVVNSYVEGGVGACGWARPAPRPAELDAAPAKARPIAPPKKKHGIVRRAADRAKAVWTRQAPVPALIEPAPAIEVAAPPADPPPKPKCDAVDALLHPANCVGR
jgi:hypothetical protein